MPYNYKSQLDYTPQQSVIVHRILNMMNKENFVFKDKTVSADKGNLRLQFESESEVAMFEIAKRFALMNGINFFTAVYEMIRI